jgi:nucleoside 2-deoxyribosyltransferase
VFPIRKRIYMAGPLFSLHERNFLEYIVKYLSDEIKYLDEKRDFFLPHRDAGDLGVIGEKDEIFSVDINYLDKAEIVIAILDGTDVDSGTAVELGFAYARGKKIFGVLTDHRSFKRNKIEHLNNMVWGVCEEGKTLILVNEIADLKRLSNGLEHFLEGKDHGR